MDYSAQTLESFLVSLKTKGLKIALISPTDGFIGTYLAEALLAQNIAVIAEINPASPARYALQHLIKNPHFFLLEYTLTDTNEQKTYQEILESIKPHYVVCDIDEALRQNVTLADLSFTLTARTKQLLDFSTKYDAVFVLLSNWDLQRHDQFHPSNFGTFSHGEQALEIKHFIETLVAEAAQKKHTKATTISYTDIYGPRMPLEATNEISHILQTAISKRAVELSGDGLTLVRPVYITDFIYGVVKALFTEGTGQTYTLINPTETTELQFAKELQTAAAKLNIHIDIVFSNVDKITSFAKRYLYNSQAAKALLWEPKVIPSEGLAKTIAFFFGRTQPLPTPKQAEVVPAPAVSQEKPKEKISHLLPSFLHKDRLTFPAIGVPQPSEMLKSAKLPQVSLPTFLSGDKQPEVAVSITKAIPRKKGMRHRLVVLAASLVIFVALAAVLPFVLLTIFSFQTTSTFSSITVGDGNTSRLSQLSDSLDRMQAVLPYTKWVYTLRKTTDTYDQTQLSLSVLQEVITSSIHLDKVDKQLGLLFKKNQNYGTVKQSLTMSLREAYEQMSLAEAKQKHISNAGSLNEAVEKAMTINQANQKIYAELAESATLANMVFADQKPQSLAILVIDNGKLNAGGGTITGLVMVTLTPGTTPTITAYDTTNPSLAVTAPAPASFTSITKQSVLTLPNALWQPQFSSGTDPFYASISQLSTAPLLGVIGIDLNTINELLKTTGPINLEASDSASYSSENFPKILPTDTSTPTRQKLILAIASKALSSIFQEATALQTLSQTLKRQSTTHHLFFNTRNQLLADFLQNRGFSDQLALKGTNYFAVLDSNIGNSAIDLGIKRTIHHDIIITDKDAINERLVITYYNEASATAKPANSAYKSFTRILLPASRKVVRLLVDNKKPAEPIITEDLGSMRSQGTVITIPSGKSITVTLEYQQTQPLVFQNNIANVSVVATKQNGTDDTPYELAIQFPKTIRLENSTPKFDIYADGVLTKTVLDQTKQFDVSFTRP